MKLFHRNKEKTIRQQEHPVLYCFLSFILPSIIILAALAGLKVTPFGDNTLVISDGNALYINYLGYVGRAVRGQENILFSFEKGMGGNMLSSWGWFLLNPFFVLFAFTDIINYMNTYTYVSVLNFCLCGLTMYVLLKDLYGHKLSNLIFSTAYALNGFLVANVFQMNFFTGVATLPLMALGLRRILNNNNPLAYILSLAYSLLTNFYFGFMLCAASVLIFLTVFIVWRDEIGNKKSIAVKYLLSSFLAGALSALVWFPALLSLKGGRLDQSITQAITFRENMPFLEIISKMFTGANDTAELSNGLPNIFVGILPVALLILFFMSKNISRKKKTAAAVLLCIYLLSFYVVVFNIAMHGGTVTNWFNYRDSFVFSFLLLVIAAEEWQYLSEEPDSYFKRAAVILLVVVLIVFSKRYEYVTGSEVLIDLAILVVMFLAFHMHRKDPKKNPKRTFEMTVLLLICVNVFLNYDFSTKKIMTWTNKETEYQETVFPVSMLVDAVQKMDGEFYRMEIGEQRSGDSGNDPMLYGYYGVGHSGSDERDFVRSASHKLGVHRFDMRNSYNEGVPSSTDSLLGLRYLISKENLTERKNYEKLVDVGDWSLYRNQDALPIAMVVEDDINEIEMKYEDVFDNLNRVWASASGKGLLLFNEEENITFIAHNVTDVEPLTHEKAAVIISERDAKSEQSETDNSQADGKSEENIEQGFLKNPPENMSYIEYTWTASQDGTVYSYNRSGVVDDRGAILPALFCDGYYHKGEKVTGYLPMTNSLVTRNLLEEVAGRFRAAYADNVALHELATIVKDRHCSIEKVKESHLRGEFTAEAGQKLMFTIPYDEGWTCFVDGEEVPINMVLGVFMAIDAPEGTHGYEMKFFPKGMKTGIGMSAFALLTTAVYVTVDGHCRKNKSEIVEDRSVLQS